MLHLNLILYNKIREEIEEPKQKDNAQKAVGIYIFLMSVNLMHDTSTLYYIIMYQELYIKL